MQDIVSFDLHRIFFGDAPFSFLLEIVFRTFIMYGYTVFLLRLLGKRNLGQLSTLELAIIICFGSAVGDPMIGANVPILFGVAGITSVAIFQFSLEWLINRSKPLEKFIEGKPEILVDNGLILLDQLKKNKISHADLFRILRGKELFHLGVINKAIFETTGQISVWLHTTKNTHVGLSLMLEEELPDGSVIESPSEIKLPGIYSCANCGISEKKTISQKINNCKRCGFRKWIMDSSISLAPKD